MTDDDCVIKISRNNFLLYYKNELIKIYDIKDCLNLQNLIQSDVDKHIREEKLKELLK